MKPAIIGCSIILGGVLALWVVCELVMQCQGG